MSPITLQDMTHSASQNATSLETTPSHDIRSILENMLSCHNSLDEFVIPAPIRFPSAVNYNAHLLAFEYREASPLCLTAPSSACRKRAREETEEAVADTENHDVSPRAPYTNGDWLTWIDWGYFAQ